MIIQAPFSRINKRSGWMQNKMPAVDVVQLSRWWKASAGPGHSKPQG